MLPPRSAARTAFDGRLINPSSPPFPVRLLSSKRFKFDALPLPLPHVPRFQKQSVFNLSGCRFDAAAALGSEDRVRWSADQSELTSVPGAVVVFSPFQVRRVAAAIAARTALPETERLQSEWLPLRCCRRARQRGPRSMVG